MRILVVGLGSMGKRRIRNLAKLGYKDIIGFDTRNDRIREVLKQYQIKSTSNLNHALKMSPDVMIISTPPDSHLIYANLAIKNGINFFSEVNLFSHDVSEMIRKTRRKTIITVPSCTMIFHPLVKELKKLLNKKTIGNVLMIQHHNGQFLPTWHPWEDYRHFFVSRRETGGARELVPVELVWLTHLFGEIISVNANIRKISKLDVDIDDTYQILLEFKNKILCTLTTDVISIPSFKETKIIGEKGTIFCDFKAGIIRINKGAGWKIVNVKMGKVAKGYGGNAPPEELYEEEIKRFLNAIEKHIKYPHELKDELKILHVLDAAEKSSIKGKRMSFR